MENYDRYKDKILEGLREGKTEKEINEGIPLARETVYKIISRLIQMGEITKIEIDMARNPDIKIVLEGLRARKSIKEIGKNVTCSLKQIYKIINKLVDAGIITREETGIVIKDDKLKEQYEKIILIGLREGRTAEEIEECVPYSLREVYRIINRLIQVGAITKEQIDEARNPNRKIVLEGLRAGKSTNEIRENVTCSISVVYRIINKLIEEGLITKKEIDIARRKKNKEQYKEIILEGLREGQTTKEIKKRLPINRETVGIIINELIDEGTITRIDIRQARQRRKAEAKERILKLFQLGFTEQEIRTIIDINKELLERRMKEMINKNQITQEEISVAYTNRRINEVRRKNSIIEGFQYKKEVSEDLIEEYIEYTTAKAHLESLEYSETELLGQVLVKDARFVTLSNVNIMLTSYTRNNAHERAIEFIDECVDVIREDSNKTAILLRARQEIIANLERREGENNKNESQLPRSQRILARQIGELEH